MGHEAIWRIVEAQAANSQLRGRELLAAAERLIAIGSRTKTTLFAFDAAGERIIGAALALSDGLDVFDVTQSFPASSDCLLVGGYIAGVAGIDAAADAVIGAGASEVAIAMISEWTEPIRNVRAVYNLGAREHAHVA